MAQDFGIHYSMLNANDQKLYSMLLFALRGCKKTLALSGVKASNMSNVFKAIDFDHPEIFYVNYGASMCVGALLGPKVLNIAYLYSMRDIKLYQQQLLQQLNAFKSEYISAYASDYEKVLKIHDYLKTHASYHFAAAANPNAVGARNAYNIVGALIDGQCVCEGYAKAMLWLCSETGIEAMTVLGTACDAQRGISGGHAWNIVKINGCYQHVDVTWDAQNAMNDFPTYMYLNLSDEQIRKNHSWTGNYPECKETAYNYFHVNNAIFGTKQALIRYLKEQLEYEEESIAIQVEEGSRLMSGAPDALHECAAQAAAQCKYVRASYLELRFADNVYVFKFSYS